MSFNAIVGLFLLAVTIHNLEEALLLPAWSRSAGKWHPPVKPAEFRFAVAVITILLYGVAGLAVIGGKGSVGAYLLLGSALAMLLNVLIPHVLATLVTRRYAPGTATALALNLPTAVMLIRKGLQAGYVQPARFYWVAPLVVLAVVAVIPVLLAVGKRIYRDK